MNIAFDAISLTNQQPGGYRTYVTNLATQLLALRTSHQIILMVERPVGLQDRENDLVKILPRKGSLGFIWREQVSIPRFARTHGIDLVHFPCATGSLWPAVPLIATILDTIEFTEALPSPRHVKLWSMRLYSRWVQRAIAREARQVITISNYSKQQIVRHFDLPPEKVRVTHLAPSVHYRLIDRKSATNQILKTYGVSSYVLGIASVAPRKNTVGLLQAYASLPESLRERHPLLLVCTHGAVRDMVLVRSAALGISRQVVLAEAVTDDQLLHLYNAAAMFVYPSIEEGFGLPPLEAMACGAPVIASDSSSLPEVLGNAALLIPPGNTQALTDAISTVLTDSVLSSTLTERGFARSQRYSWYETAQQTVAAYETALDLSRPQSRTIGFD